MYGPRWLAVSERFLRGDLVINGTHVAFIQHGQTIILDLPPGRYILRWQLRDRITDTPMPEHWARSITSSVVLTAGATTAFAADVFDAREVVPSLIPGARTSGGVATGLTPAVNSAILLAHAPTILSPQPDRLAAVPGAQLAGR